jgi:hypothetical protein
MAQIVAGFGVPHTPIFPHFVKRDGPDCEIAKLFGAQKEQLAATRPDLIVMFDTDHLNTFFLDALPTRISGRRTTSRATCPITSCRRCRHWRRISGRRPSPPATTSP